MSNPRIDARTPGLRVPGWHARQAEAEAADPSEVHGIIECHECDEWHEAEYHHDGHFGEGPIYAVICPTDNLTSYYTGEVLVVVRARVGELVTAIPVGQRRRQTFTITRFDGEYAHGMLVSRKHPGSYRGHVTAYAGECMVVPVNPAESIARVTGSTSATYVEERRNADGSLSVVSSQTWTRA